MEKIVIDANVLYSNTLRSLFLWLMWRGECATVWTKEIWEEVFRNYSKDSEKEKIFRTQIENNVFVKFHSCMCILESDFSPAGLPDLNDEHVLALARQERAALIVTFNLRDFPEEKLKSYGIKSSHPDSYLCALLQRSGDAVKESIAYQMKANHLTKPKKNMYFESLKKSGVTEFSKMLEGMDHSGNLFPEVWT